MSAHQVKLLKVFSGPHIGAEIVLHDGEYLLGRGESCDVVFDDRNLHDEHVRLQVRGESVFATPVAGAKIFLDGEEVEETAVEEFQYLTLGSTTVAYGPESGEWPTRELPIIRLTQMEAPSESVESVTPEQAGVAEATGNDSAVESAPKREAWRWIVAASMLALLAIGGIVVFSSGGFGSADKPAPPVTKEILVKIIDKAAPGSSVEVVESDEAFAARGYVIKRDTLDALETALSKADPSIDITELWDTERIARSAEGFLRMRKLDDLKVEVGQPGQITVSGVLSDLSEWEKARAEIRQKTRVRELVDDVKTPETKAVATAPTVWEGRRPIKPRVELPAPVAPANTATPDTPATPVTPATTVGTSAAPPDTPADPPTMTPPPITRPVVAKSNSKKTVKSDVDPANEYPLPFFITDVTIGRSKFFTTDKGSEVRENAVVQGGYTVEQIEGDRVVFSKNGQNLVVKLGNLNE